MLITSLEEALVILEDGEGNPDLLEKDPDFYNLYSEATEVVNKNIGKL